MSKSTTIALAALLLLGWAVAACGQSEPALKGTVLDPPRPVPDFTLSDQHGRTFRMSDQQGYVVLLFFGYTHCPDVCPTTLSTWKRVHETLGHDADGVRFVFVTVDPERDTPEWLRQHLEIFNSDFIGLTGAQDELEAVYKDFGVFYEKDTTSESAAGYLVSHTASTFVIDRQGRWRTLHAFGAPVEDIVHDIRQLLK